MVTRIYDRPDLDQRRGIPALYVSGLLPYAEPGVAYEGRLQIHNAVGACSVEQIDGDVLPPGHSITVDNESMEVVIAWPAYAEEAAPIQNPGFEDGISGWVPGAGWSVNSENPIAGARSAAYQRNSGSSVLSSASRYPVTPGALISAQCQVRQGASSAGNAGAGVRLEFRNSSGAVVGTADGNYVMSASKNAVYPSSVVAASPSGVDTVNIACVGVRHRENKDVWVDSFSWNHKAAIVGVIVKRVFNLTLRVRDSAGRTALWIGIIRVENADPVAVSIMAKLTSWWEMTESSGNRMDSKGSSHLSIVGTVTTAPGVRGGEVAAAFAGSGGLIVPSNLSLRVDTGGGAHCMFGWIYLTSNSGIQYFFNKWDDVTTTAPGAEYMGSVVSSNYYAQNGGTSYTSVITPAPAAGAWHFYVMWRDPVDGKLRLQLDNGTVISSAGASNPSGTDAPLFFARNQAGNYRMSGRLQRWGWMNGEILTADERAWLFNGGSGRTFAEVRAAAGM